jgi:nitroimidazol reductase NimA-like FMN-containing flavoprotein (pyridoxamine 5'-phosphate oxidase superfamily)
MNEPMELDVDECLDLLAREEFGRLGLSTPSGPRIVPLNYALVDDAVVFRTSPYSELARSAIGREAAFEIDHVDHAKQTGWSVVVIGRIEDVDPADLEDLRKVWAPQPWPGGQRTLSLQLRWREVSGRRLRESPTTPAPARRVC